MQETPHHKCTSFGGFTLLELLLYVSIATSLLLAVTFFLSTIVESRIKNQTIAEVEGQGLHVMQIMMQTIRNTEAITSPAAGSSASSLTLDVVTASKDPTIFDLLGGAIRIKEGTGTAVALTNARVVVSNLTFQNLSRTGTPGTIRISFTLTHINPENRQAYTFQKIFRASASLRHP